MFLRAKKENTKKKKKKRTIKTTDVAQMLSSSLDIS
jgi:hypothetical protein